MATVHPSRMGLVPQDTKDVYPDIRRPASNRDRKETRDARGRESDDNSDRGRGRDRERERERPDDRYERRRDRNDDRTSPRRRDDGRRVDDRDRDRERERERERERYGDRDRGRERSRSRRRGSPEYGDYKRPPSSPPGPGSEAPRMYPSRPPRDGMYERRGGYGGGGNDYLESRRAQREVSMFSIWPPSPKAPARALSPERGSSRRKSKRDRSETPTESSDSESERRRRERKERKRARKEKERRERRERKERRRRSRSYDTEEEEHSRERDRHRRSKSKSRPRSPSASPAPSSPRMSEGEEDWVEKPAAATPFVVAPQSNGSMPPPATIPSYTNQQVEEEDDDSDMDVGPQPLIKATASKKVDERTYGGALLRGEGSAMAAFLQDDTQSRIPRRGEIGLTSDEIAQFESVGYVMSGSRHKRMNAVRMRKENQVISAEEKRGILKLQKEERERREAILREEFSELIQDKLKGPETKRSVT